MSPAEAGTGTAEGTQRRNHGIDLLRIVAMFMVVVLHVVGQGGVITACAPGSTGYAASRLLQALTYVAVDCFGLISGYVGRNARFRLSNLLIVWFQTFFWCVAVTFAFQLLRPDFVGLANWRQALLPIASATYWYVSAYCCVFFFAPFVNALLDHLSAKGRAALMALLVGLFSVLTFGSSALDTDPFGLDLGYSALWLVTLYAIGAWVKGLSVAKKVGVARPLAVYAICSIASWAAVLAWPESRPYVLSYTAPLVLASSIAILVAFANLRLSPTARRVVAFAAPCAFGVYLIHVNPLVWEHLLTDRFALLSDASGIMCAAKVLGVATAIFCACILAEWIRIKAFRATGITRTLNHIGERVQDRLFLLAHKLGEALV